jgi:branched-subunit amino acid ABC-type transport system permease component
MAHDLVQNTVDGLMIGTAYALLALGFTLIFGVMRRLNLSYGPSIMLGAYLGTFAHLELGLGAPVVAVITILGAVAAGFYVERLCFAPMRGQAATASMVASFAIWMQLEELATLILPRHSYPFPALTAQPPLEIAGLLLRVDHLVMLATAGAAMLALWLMVHRSAFGLALRATARDPGTARYLGIDVERAGLIAFLGASALGGLAGALVIAADQQITPMFGMWATFKGLVAMMLGGLGSIPGAVLGGLVLGIVEAHGQWFLGPQLRDLLVYALLFLCLVLRAGIGAGTAPAERRI